MTKLHRRHAEHGQSPWLDNINRRSLGAQKSTSLGMCTDQSTWAAAKTGLSTSSIATSR